MIRNCRLCGAEYEQPKGWKLGNACSVRCVAWHARRRKNPERFAERICVICGKGFIPKRKHTEKCCSPSCYKRNHYLKNKLRLDAYRAQWSKKNRKKQQSYVNKCRDNKPEHYRLLRRVSENRRRTRMNGNLTAAEWEALKAKYNYACLRCGKREPKISLTIDHIVAVCNGGSNSIENIQPLCRPCNTSKNKKTADYRPVRQLTFEMMA